MRWIVMGLAIARFLGAAFDILLLLCVATVPSSSPKASLPAILALPAK
jgi:hypothetical protein